MDASSSRQQLQGTCLVVGGALVHSLVALIVQANSLPLLYATQCRYALGWAISLGFLLAYKKERGLSWFGPPGFRAWLLLNGMLHFMFIVLWWLAIRHAPLGDCIAVIFCSPVLTAPLSWLLLSERMPPLMLPRAFLVIFGIWLIVNPPFLRWPGGAGRPLDGAQPAAAPPEPDYTFLALALLLCPLLPIMTYQTRARSWIEVEHVNGCVASVALNPSLLLAQYVLLRELPRVPLAAPREVGLILLASGCSFLARVMDTNGFQLAEPGKAAMFRCLEVPFAFVLQSYGAGDAVNWREIWGTAAILLACILGIVGQNITRPADEHTPLCA